MCYKRGIVNDKHMVSRRNSASFKKESRNNNNNYAVQVDNEDTNFHVYKTTQTNNMLADPNSPNVNIFHLKSLISHN